MSKVSPQRFGKYVLLRRLALGGMAEIFKAKAAGAEGFEKDLVVKRILPHYSDDETFVQMFIDEARITAKLQHPNIVQIFDFAKEDDSYYIAMEYIEGKDLKDVLEQSLKQNDPLSVAQCVWIAIEVAKALQYAHSKEERGQPLNIVHRDVTPSNIMLTYRGDVKLMDFGIAKATQRSTKTQAGAVKGKVAYMSPEQARGKLLDGRTDIFALGVVMWEMLTRTRLFLAESDFETLNNVLRMEAPPPSSINPDVPATLDPIIAKCIAKEPNQRWSSADALARDLTRWYYANVTDLEKEKLKPLMFRLFKRDIDALEQEALEDDAFMSGAIPRSAEATAQGTQSGTGPVSESATRVDGVAAATVGRPGGVRDDLTRVGYTATSSQMHQVVQAKRKSSPLPWILLVLLLLGGGVAAFFLATGDKSPTTPTSVAQPDVSEPAKNMATLYIKVDPHTAKVKVNDQVVGGEVPNLTIGQKVRIVAEAPGYKRFEEIIDINDPAPVYPIKMEREGVAHRVIIRPSGENDQVFVDDVKLGLGTQPFDGLIDQNIVVKVVPAAGGPPITRIVKLDASMATVDISTTSELVVTLVPADATLKASAGKTELRSGGVVAVMGLAAGQQVTLEVTAKDFKAVSRTIEVAQGPQTLSLTLEKVAKAPDADPKTPPKTPDPKTPPKTPDPKTPDPKTPPKTPDPEDKGSLMISARPWAQVSVNGRPYGTTPRTVALPAGSYTVVLTKGLQTVTKSVKVTPGQQAQVFADFSE